MEQSEHINLWIKFTVLHGHGSECPKTITVVTSKITDDIINTIVMQKSGTV